jgi:hypothetical protein
MEELRVRLADQSCNFVHAHSRDEVPEPFNDTSAFLPVCFIWKVTDTAEEAREAESFGFLRSEHWMRTVIASNDCKRHGKKHDETPLSHSAARAKWSSTNPFGLRGECSVPHGRISPSVPGESPRAGSAAPPKAKSPITAQAPGLARTIADTGEQRIRKRSAHRRSKVATVTESLRFQGQRERRNCPRSLL